VFRPTASTCPSCQTLGGSAGGSVSFELCVSQLGPLRVARLPAVFRPRVEFARQRSLYAHHLRATRPSAPSSLRPALPVPRGRRPPSLPACRPSGHVMLGACNRPAFVVGLRLTQRSSGHPTAARVCMLLHHLWRRWLPLTSTLERSQVFESSPFTVALHLWPRSARAVRPSALNATLRDRPAKTVGSGTSLARVAGVVTPGYRSLRARSQQLGRF
jgi:hypothetical protein